MEQSELKEIMRLAVLSACVCVCLSVFSVCLCTQIGGDMHSNERLLVFPVFDLHTE